MFRDAFISKWQHLVTMPSYPVINICPDLKNTQPQMYETLIGTLSDDEKGVLQGVVKQADANQIAMENAGKNAV